LLTADETIKKEIGDKEEKMPVTHQPFTSAFDNSLPAPYSPHPSPPCLPPPPEAAPPPPHVLSAKPDAAAFLLSAARGSDQAGTPSLALQVRAPPPTPATLGINKH